MAIPNPKWLVSGPQVICKADFIELEDAILGSGAAGQGAPPLVWEDADTVRVDATVDCPTTALFTGFPNIFNPASQVHGGLSDNIGRTITANVSLVISSGGIWGTEKASQWYAVLALAEDADTDFVLKAMPYMRVKSQAGNVLSLGNLLAPATGIGYGLTTDEMVGGKVYFLTGASKGLMRAITANNNDDATGGTVTYTGDTLSVAEGDWFIILPPGYNFRWLGDLWNDSGSDTAAVGDLILGESSYLFTAHEHWFCPLTWKRARVNGVAGGGGGGSCGTYGAGGKGGAGAIGLPVTVVPGTYYSITPGAGGAGGTNNVGTAGTNTTISEGVLTLTGGAGGPYTDTAFVGGSSPWGGGGLSEGEDGQDYGGGGAGADYLSAAGNGANGFLEIMRY